MSLEIVSVSADEGLLPACIPSLMPFHVSYSGPAPVSRYLRPRPVPSSGPGSAILPLRSSSSSTLVASSSTTSIVGGPVTCLTTMSSTASLGSPTGGSPPQENEPLGKTGPEVVTQVEQLALAETTEKASVEMEMDSERQPTLDTLPRDNLSGSTAHIDAARSTERFVAAFRGRQMYGQGVDIPEGYGGLVLRTPPSSEGDAMKLLSQKNKPKLRTRVATRRKRAMADESAEERDGEEDIASAADGDLDSPPPTRKLIPSSQFTSFMLWTSDRPLDEGRDGYARALIEWTRLASEIHSCDE